MSEHFPLSELRVVLGFDSTLRLVYPNGKTLDLPRGEAEARMVEILSGFRLTLAQARAAAKPKAPGPVEFLSISDLDL